MVFLEYCRPKTIESTKYPDTTPLTEKQICPLILTPHFLFLIVTIDGNRLRLRWQP